MLLLGDKPSNCEKDGTLFTINKVSKEPWMRLFFVNE
jgi:hypothetical protein